MVGLETLNQLRPPQSETERAMMHQRMETIGSSEAITPEELAELIYMVGHIDSSPDLKPKDVWVWFPNADNPKIELLIGVDITGSRITLRDGVEDESQAEDFESVISEDGSLQWHQGVSASFYSKRFQRHMSIEDPPGYILRAIEPLKVAEVTSLGKEIYYSYQESLPNPFEIKPDSR